MLLEPADEAGQRTLAQVDGVGQILHAELALVVLGEAVEHLELADAEPVPLAKLAFERCADSGMTSGQRPPRADDLRPAARTGLAGIPGRTGLAGIPGWPCHGGPLAAHRRILTSQGQ